MVDGVSSRDSIEFYQTYYVSFYASGDRDVQDDLSHSLWEVGKVKHVVHRKGMIAVCSVTVCRRLTLSSRRRISRIFCCVTLPSRNEKKKRVFPISFIRLRVNWVKVDTFGWRYSLDEGWLLRPSGCICSSSVNSQPIKR